MTAKDYTLEYMTATLASADYIASCCDPVRIGGYCRECPSYGTVWVCPPLCFDARKRAACYERIMLVGTKITPCRPMSFAEGEDFVAAERLAIERRLLTLEGRCKGWALAFSGRCLHCAEACTRHTGGVCRHPEMVRPSLEACGFDIEKTAREIFGVTLKWSKDNMMPDYLFMVSGIFFNGDDIVW
ncbi:MAG: DUF2284 domain-containing protein [Rikenellaceae bacterium]|nr:DUF2284 domain-containing protein [Rikenellaceae bacterium]MDE7134929.1 DUF2284 domain-containing protein [Rikenellaceae bacterium]MDE7355531.1 DUF2284 domain-containing protein [Rikenellaceae bacterium]